MAIPTPEWLRCHDGALRPGVGGHSWVVLLANEPQYVLTPQPAKGHFSCEVLQTVNARRLSPSALCTTADEAVHAGLEALRQNLGW